MIIYVIVGAFLCFMAGVFTGVGILAICSINRFEEDDCVEDWKCGTDKENE